MKTVSSAAYLLPVIAVVLTTAAVVASERAPPTIEYLARHSGFYNLSRSSSGARLFYVFFPSIGKKTNAPLIIWLQGGPGASDEFGLFRLNGPIHLSNNASLIWNEYTWNKDASVLYVDQPIGTGFSDVVDNNDLCRDLNCASNDLYEFLQAFLRKNPRLAKNGFYITGESFAGQYVPAFASRILRGNKAREGVHVNLKGVAIGNGLTNPEIQYPSLQDYAIRMGVINETVYQDIDQNYLPSCLESLKKCGSGVGGEICELALYECDAILNRILNISGVSPYDVRKKCAGNCSEDPVLQNFLNQPLVKQRLGLGDRQFSLSNGDVFKAMMPDGMHSHALYVPLMLEDGVQVLVYVGEYDLICNWMGNLGWVQDLKWWGKAGFATSANQSFIVDGVEKGVLRTFGPLAFLKVHNAGHMVPGDQPKVALQMIQKWIDKKLIT